MVAKQATTSNNAQRRFAVRPINRRLSSPVAYSDHLPAVATGLADVLNEVGVMAKKRAANEPAKPSNEHNRPAIDEPAATEPVPPANRKPVPLRRPIPVFNSAGECQGVVDLNDAECVWEEDAFYKQTTALDLLEYDEGYSLWRFEDGRYLWCDTKIIGIPESKGEWVSVATALSRVNELNEPYYAIPDVLLNDAAAESVTTTSGDNPPAYHAFVLSERHQAILFFLADKIRRGTAVTQTAIADGVDSTEKTVGKLLEKLRAAGLTHRPHGDKGGEAITTAGLARLAELRGGK